MRNKGYDQNDPNNVFVNPSDPTDVSVFADPYNIPDKGCGCNHGKGTVLNYGAYLFDCMIIVSVVIISVAITVKVIKSKNKK